MGGRNVTAWKGGREAGGGCGGARCVRKAAPFESWERREGLDGRCVLWNAERRSCAGGRQRSYRMRWAMCKVREGLYCDVVVPT